MGFPAATTLEMELIHYRFEEDQFRATLLVFPWNPEITLSSICLRCLKTVFKDWNRGCFGFS
jgi:hypothetical protein